MPRAPAHFREADVVRLIRAAERAGMQVGRVEVDPKTGRIVVLRAGGEPADDGALDAELREWRAKRDG